MIEFMNRWSSFIMENRILLSSLTFALYVFWSSSIAVSQWKKYKETKQTIWRTWRGYALQSGANALLILNLNVKLNNITANTINGIIVILFVSGCYLTRKNTVKKKQINET